jgi:threonine/homoserine/homoserine lactone efflux protein
MESLVFIVTIIFIHLLAVASPGPDFVLAVRNSLTYGRRAGIFTAWGFALGIVVHLFYCYVGIALLISQIPTLFSAIKIIGAIYLLYIAYQIFTHRQSTVEVNFEEKGGRDISDKAAFSQGFWTNVLNPKATLFFLGLFTTAIPPNIDNLSLGAASFFMVLDTGLWFSLVAIIFTQKKSLQIFQNYAVYINTVLSLLLTALSLKILFF